LISNHFRDSVGGPEKAGVGGSIPSLATKLSTTSDPKKACEKFSRAQYAHIDFSHFHFLTLFRSASNHVAAPGPNVQPNSARKDFYPPDVCFGFEGDS